MSWRWWVAIAIAAAVFLASVVVPFFYGFGEDRRGFYQNILAEVAGVLAAVGVAWVIFERRSAGFEARVKQWLHGETARADARHIASGHFVEALEAILDIFLEKPHVDKAGSRDVHLVDWDEFRDALDSYLMSEWNNLVASYPAVISERPEIVRNMDIVRLNGMIMETIDKGGIEGRNSSDYTDAAQYVVRVARGLLTEVRGSL